MDAGLLYSVHLALELSQLSGDLTVSADKECGGPEHDDSHAGSDLIVRPLLILNASSFRNLRRSGLRFPPELLASVKLIWNRQDVVGRDLGWQD